MYLHSSWARAWTAAALVTFSLTVPAAAQTADSRSAHPVVDIGKILHSEFKKFVYLFDAKVLGAMQQSGG